MKTRFHGQRFIYPPVPWGNRMTTHTRGRDPVPTPADTGKPGAGEKTTRKPGRVKYIKTKYGRMAVPFEVWARPEKGAKA